MKAKKTFEQRVAEVTEATVASMIANALYNSPSNPNKVYASTDEVYASYVKTFGARVVHIKEVSFDEKLAALASYAERSDFSAFKKWDLQAAINSLTA